MQIYVFLANLDFLRETKGVPDPGAPFVSLPQQRPYATSTGVPPSLRSTRSRVNDLIARGESENRVQA